MATGTSARRITAALAAILLALSGAAAVGAGGTIYKWTDKEGNVHFTDCPPPPGCTVETVLVQPKPSEQQRLELERQQIAALQAAVERRRIHRRERRTGVPG